MIKILYFAGLREALGIAFEEVELPAGTSSVASLRELIVARGEVWRALAEAKNLRAAVNQKMVGPDAAVVDGDEVAFFPPVTGG